MEPFNTLCQHCATIPFEELANGRQVATTEFSMGPPSRVKMSAEECAFCRLVLDCAVSNFMARHCFESGPDVKLRWESGGAQRGREGFQAVWAPGKTLAFISTPQKPLKHSYLAPAINSRIDIPRILNWIKNCGDNHTLCRPPLSSAATFEDIFPELEVLRLIDVETNCLVEKRAHVPYLALSYVWGSVVYFKLKKINKPELMRPGILANVWNHIPPTITDAIDLTRKLGIRYLWVDSICLVQNDSDDLERGVNVMDQIFEHAWLTIIAAHGHDAIAGLPGLRPGTRQRKLSAQCEVGPGLTLGQVSSFQDLLGETVYQTRAWTYQEKVLSRRNLCFFTDQVIFTCCENQCFEVCTDDPSRWALTNPTNIPSSLRIGTLEDYDTPAPWYTRPAMLEGVDTPARCYARMLEAYTTKSLTNSGDILRAFEGIMRRSSQMMGYRMMQGIPVGSFDFFIPFFVYGNSVRRPGFPSYSWAGWFGTKVIYYRDETELNVWLRERTWIIWYKRDPDGVVSPVWDPAANPLFPIDDPKFEGYRERYPFTSPIEGIDTSRTRPSAEAPALRPVPSYPLLQFWTLVISLKIEEINVFYADGGLVGKDGVHYGRAKLDWFGETALFESTSPLDILVLSEADADTRNYDRSGAITGGPATWTHYNVMLIEWNQGIAERRGMGRMLKEGVHQSFEPGPVWKEIILG